jgi:hypothetical protein
LLAGRNEQTLPARSNVGAWDKELLLTTMPLADFLAVSLGLSKIPPFIPTILLSFAGFTFVHIVLAPRICSHFWPFAYGSKARAVQNSWCVSSVFLPALLTPAPKGNSYRLTGPLHRRHLRRSLHCLHRNP